MAEVDQGSAFPGEAASPAIDSLNATDSNGTDSTNATVAKFVSTPEGTALAYGSLVLMALLPIFFGALRSVNCAKGKNSSDMPETITSRDAARFPIIASCTLFGLYLFFKDFSAVFVPPHPNLPVYLSVNHICGSPFVNRLFPENFPNKQYQLLFTQGSEENKEEIVNYEFDTKDLLCLCFSSVVGVWYILKKVSFELVCIVLKLGSAIILNKNSRTYFYTGFLAYIFGLGLTIFVMHTFKHAQPALLYLVPACTGLPFFVALVKGELTEMFR
ncbi:UNVERIFIED_CONTAM: hypothetical protein FKN15_077185 [Acipenser sinensis]